MKELDEQYKDYVGIDEAGLGCVGGSLWFTGAVLKKDVKIEEISFADDSKKLTYEKRAQMTSKLIDLVDTLILRYTASTIDEKGLSWCCSDALKSIRDKFPNNNVIYDGNKTFDVQGIEVLVKADAKISLVSAASIIAKTFKDNEMIELSKEYPMYGFEKHKGYVTKIHKENIKKYGLCEAHRKSYKLNL